MNEANKHLIGELEDQEATERESTAVTSITIEAL